MGWRDRLQRGGFRGVAFYTENHDLQSGRRTASHEYPGRDQPYHEDLGRKARQWSIDAYLIGEDYDRQRDALLEACEKSGGGELVHPYLGSFEAVCTSIRVRESKGEGRMARISLTFSEAGEDALPRDIPNQAAQVDAAAGAMAEASEASFVDQFSVDGMPQFGLDAAIENVEAVVDGVENAVDSVESAVSGFTRKLTRLRQDVSDLIQTPGKLASRMTDMVQSVAANFEGDQNRPTKAYDATSRLFGVGDDEDDVATTTSTRQQQADNQAAVFSHGQNVAVGEAARAAVRVDWQTRRDALAAADKLAQDLDDRMESVESDELYLAMQELRARVVESVPPPDQALPRLRPYTPPQTMPSLVIAYHLYQDAGRAEEIVARNDVRHPGFIQGGQELEVRND